eukprot:scaffold40305_cov66-Phaeocystis_antarctica.AAC.1
MSTHPIHDGAWWNHPFTDTIQCSLCTLGHQHCPGMCTSLALCAVAPPLLPGLKGEENFGRDFRLIKLSSQGVIVRVPSPS